MSPKTMEAPTPNHFHRILLYLPYYSWLMAKIVKSGQIKISVLLGATVLGAIPMCIHGYRILFLGGRLF